MPAPAITPCTSTSVHKTCGATAINRSTPPDPNYTDAKVNREYVVRKVKELARKEKEKKEKENEERAIVEKLQEIIAAQTEAHATARFFMRLAGFDLPPSKISELAIALDQAPGAFIGLFEGRNTGKMVVKLSP